MADFVDYVALLFRALPHLPGLQMLLLGISAFLMGIALARVARRLRIYPALPRLRLPAILPGQPPPPPRTGRSRVTQGR